MKVIPFAAYIERAPSIASASTAAAVVQPVLPQHSHADEVAEARAVGERDGREAARQEYEAALATEKERLETRLAEARQGWVVEQGRELSTLIGSGLACIEETIADVTARLIEPLLVADARKTSLNALKEALRDITTKSEAATIRIEGPEDLLLIMRDSLGGANNIIWAPASRCDIHVETSNTVMETRLEAWLAHLKEALR